MAFDTLRYPSIPFEVPRDAFEALRTLSKPFSPLPLLHNISSLDPSGPPPSTNNFELLKRQFEPFRISRLISQVPLAGLHFRMRPSLFYFVTRCLVYSRALAGKPLRVFSLVFPCKVSSYTLLLYIVLTLVFPCKHRTL